MLESDKDDTFPSKLAIVSFFTISFSGSLTAITSTSSLTCSLAIEGCLTSSIIE